MPSNNLTDEEIFNFVRKRTGSLDDMIRAVEAAVLAKLPRGHDSTKADRLLAHTEKIATMCGWTAESAEGAFECIQRTSYAQGVEDAKTRSRLQEPVAKVVSANGGLSSNPVVIWFVGFSGTTPDVKDGDWLFAHPAQKPLSDAYEKGWREAAKWANRDDLVSDIGSPAYLKDMAARGIKEKP